MEYKVRDIGQTDNNKKVGLHYNTNTNLYSIKFAPGGALPKEFQGQFTSASAAEKTVKGYLARKQQPAKKVRNG